jgi:hypothetical protein
MASLGVKQEGGGGGQRPTQKNRQRRGRSVCRVRMSGVRIRRGRGGRQHNTTTGTGSANAQEQSAKQRGVWVLVEKPVVQDPPPLPSPFYVTSSRGSLNTKLKTASEARTISAEFQPSCGAMGHGTFCPLLHLPTSFFPSFFLCGPSGPGLSVFGCAWSTHINPTNSPHQPPFLFLNDHLLYRSHYAISQRPSIVFSSQFPRANYN